MSVLACLTAPHVSASVDSDQPWPVGTYVKHQFTSGDRNTGYQRTGTTVRTITGYNAATRRYEIRSETNYTDNKGAHRKIDIYEMRYDSRAELQARLASCEARGGERETVTGPFGEVEACRAVITDCHSYPCKMVLWSAVIPFGLIRWQTDVRDGTGHYVSSSEVVAFQ